MVGASESLAVDGIISPTYSTYFLPSKDEMDAMLDELDMNGLGEFTRAFYAYWTSSHQGGESAGPYYAGWSVEEWIFGYNLDPEDGQEFDALNVRPIRYFDHTNDTDFPLQTLMPSGGYIFYIDDIGGGEYRHYECAPTDIEGSKWYNPLTPVYTPILGDGIGAGLDNTNEIVNSAGHTYSSANDCLNYGS
jgi:hypothetical protein